MNNTADGGARIPAPIADDANPDLRILRRAEPLDAFPCTDNPRAPFMKVAIVDVETTGTDPQNDEVIDIAIALITIDAFGRIVEIIDSAESLRDPARPIPARITTITGISDADVGGVSFDPSPFVDLLRAANVCISHNAGFDAPFVERLLPEARGLPWACSMREFDWVATGFDGCKLGHLLMQIGKFGETHRAIADVTNLIHVLAHDPDGSGTVMASVIKSAMRPTMLVEATRALYRYRGELRSAGYVWDPARGVWWKEVDWGIELLERAWLQESILPRGQEPNIVGVTWRERYR